MASVQYIDHTVIAVSDLQWAEWFYTEVLGGKIIQRQGLTIDQLIRGRKRMERRLQRSGDVQVPAPHTAVEMGEATLPIFIHRKHIQEPPLDQLRGTPRVAFEVKRGQLSAAVEKLKEKKVPFEGPVRHPGGSPIGESIYFKDRSGNFMELCWAKEEAPKTWAGKGGHV